MIIKFIMISLIINYGTPKKSSVMKTYSCNLVIQYLGLIVLGVSSLCSNAIAQQKVPYQLSSHGDQSTVQVTANNFGSEARLFKLGPRGGQLVEQSIAPYAAHTYQVQCLSRNDTQETPLLDFALRQNSEDQYAKFSEWITRQDDPRKIIWNRGSYQSTNKLGQTLRKTLERIYSRPVRSIRNNTFLTHLSAWARVEVFLSSLKPPVLLLSRSQGLLPSSEKQAAPSGRPGVRTWVRVVGRTAGKSAGIRHLNTFSGIEPEPQFS